MLVVDLSRSVGGRFCGRLFALAGERVVRSRRRSRRTPLLDRHVALDLYLGRDVEALDERAITTCLEEADVVLTSFESGAYSTPHDETHIRRANPLAIHTTVSPFGTTGPRAALPSSDLVDWAASGYLWLTGDPDKPPLPGPREVCQYAAGYVAYMATEAAVLRRAETAKGIHLDVSVQEAMLMLHQKAFSRLAAGVPMRRSGGTPIGVSPMRAYRCADGDVYVCVVTDVEFERLAAAIGCPEMAADPRFVTAAARIAHQDDLDAAIAAFTSERHARDVAAALQRARVAAARVAEPADVLTDEQLRVRGFAQHIATPYGDALVPGNPIRSSQYRSTSRVSARRPAPPLVLDITLWWAGPLASRLLADLGARVLRVEAPPGATSHPDATGPTLDWRFVDHKMNRNKQGIALDIRDERGAAILAELAAQADVLIDNYRPGVLERAGLGHERLQALNPRLVHVALSGFGSSGPKSAWGSYGTLIEMASSIASRTRYAGGPPTCLAHALPDGIGGVVGAAAAVRGLRVRTETGVGGYYDLSQLEAYVALAGEAILLESLAAAGARPVHEPWHHAALYQCRGDDEWLAVETLSHDEVEDLARCLAEVTPRGGESVERLADDVQMRESALRRLAQSMSKEALGELLSSRNLRALPVLRPEDLVADEHLRARGAFVPVRVEGGFGHLPGFPPVAEGFGSARNASAPRCGEHTRSVLAELIGFDRARIDALHEDGVVFCAS